jgi:hypothetical protein
MAIWLATMFRTNRYRPVSDGEHCTVIQSVLVRFTDTMAQIRLLVLELASPTCMYQESAAMTLAKTLTDATVTRRPKSTCHHWLLPSIVAEKVDTLLSLADRAGFTKSCTPTATSVLNVLDCVAAHVSFRNVPHDIAKLSCVAISSYVGPRYPALHVQSQIDTEPTGDALVGTHAAQTRIPVLFAYVFAAHGEQLPCTPEDPTSQMHWALPSGDTLFEEQELHVEKFVAATLAEKLFAGHALHAELPGKDLYVPAGHSWQNSGRTMTSTSVPCALNS